MKTWYRVVAKADESVAEIHIIDFIGDWIDDMYNRFFGENIFGVTARAFVEDLSKLPEAVKTIRVHINSPGGDVFSALNIANALRDQQVSKGRTVETVVDGLAASAASIIAMAGSKVTMADNALMMIHNPWFVAIGDSREMRKAADELDKVRTTIVATYQWHSELEDADIVAAMDAETWLDADEAIAKGFATDKAQGLKAAASINPRAIAALKVPDKFKARVDQLIAQPAPAPTPAAASEVMTICANAGLDLPFAQTLIDGKCTADQARARASEEKANRAASAARADEISKLCASAKLPELAAGYIKGAMSVVDIKAHLTTLTAKLDAIEVDGGLPPDHGKKKARIDTAAIYARMNGPATH